MLTGTSRSLRATQPRSFTTEPRAIRISPSRRRIDPVSPSLAFTIDTGGLPFCEVLLALDAALFLGERGGDRTSANFHSSRESAKLIRAAGGVGLYVVPARVLQTFLAAAAPYRSIYFTAIAYATESAEAPRFEHPPELLAQRAQSIPLPLTKAAGAQMMPTAMGIRVRGALTAPEEPAARPPRAPSMGQSAMRHEDARIVRRRAPTHRSQVDDLDYRDGGTAPPVVRRSAASALDYDDGVESPASMSERAPIEYDDGVEAPRAPSAFAAAFPGNGARAGYGDDDLEAAAAPLARTKASPPPSGASWDAAFDALDEDEGLATPPLTERSPSPPAGVPATPMQLSAEVKRHIVETVAALDTGAARYDALNLDGEFRGRFGQNDPHYQRAHAGLGFGIGPFGQDNGTLGQLLEAMRTRDPAEFAAIFGPAADELVRVTTAPGPRSTASPEGRSARVQPVESNDLWEEPWIGRFKKAAEHAPFQAAQNQLAATLFLDPVVPLAHTLGIATERGLAMLFERSREVGADGAASFAVEALETARTEAERMGALQGLGHAGLAEFQKAAAIEPADGTWSVASRAALIGALRSLGASAPVQLPGYREAIERLATAATEPRMQRRLGALHAETKLSDSPLTA
jgi:hypothetical protein